jgi:hypothetical protein
MDVVVVICLPIALGAIVIIYALRPVRRRASVAKPSARRQIAAEWQRTLAPALDHPVSTPAARRALEGPERLSSRRDPDGSRIQAAHQTGWLALDGHECDPPRSHIVEPWEDFLPAGPIGAVWRCRCGRLWTIVADRHGPGVPGRSWAQARWRLRRQYRHARVVHPSWRRTQQPAHVSPRTAPTGVPRSPEARTDGS